MNVNVHVDVIVYLDEQPTNEPPNKTPTEWMRTSSRVRLGKYHMLSGAVFCVFSIES